MPMGVHAHTTQTTPGYSNTCKSTPAPGKKSEGEGKMIKCLNRHLHHLSELILSEVPLRSRARYEAGERSRVQC